VLYAADVKQNHISMTNQDQPQEYAKVWLRSHLQQPAAANKSSKHLIPTGNIARHPY
jgi:hypothetical protein